MIDRSISDRSVDTFPFRPCLVFIILFLLSSSTFWLFLFVCAIPFVVSPTFHLLFIQVFTISLLIIGSWRLLFLNDFFNLITLVYKEVQLVLYFDWEQGTVFSYIKIFWFRKKPLSWEDRYNSIKNFLIVVILCLIFRVTVTLVSFWNPTFSKLHRQNY